MQPSISISTAFTALSSSFAYCQSFVSTQAIAFYPYLTPFIQLLSSNARDFIVVLFDTSLQVAYFCERTLSAVEVVFQRLIFAPSFDPNDPFFKAGIQQLAQQVPDLKKRIEELNSQFCRKHLISRDMENLKKLSDEISKAGRQLDYYVRALEHRVQPFPIQEQLVEVRDAFHALDNEVTAFCLDRGGEVLDQFESIASLFSRGASELPYEIQQQLVQTWKDLESVFSYHFTKERVIIPAHFSNFSNIKKMMRLLIQNKVASHYVEPLELNNIGNSCYLDSVLQSILCIDYIREKLSEEPERDLERNDYSYLQEYLNKVAIQQGIFHFIEEQRRVTENRHLSQMELILFLLENSSEKGGGQRKLREAIFKSNYSNLNQTTLMRQHDPAIVMELLINRLLPECAFYHQIYTSTTALPGLEFQNGFTKENGRGREEYLPCLQISLRNKEKNQTLERLVKLSLGKHVEKTNRCFFPEEGIPIQGKEKEMEESLMKDKAEVEKFVEWCKFTRLPPVLTIQFKRFTGDLFKDNRSVILPKSGILDISNYYDAPVGESKKVLYKVKGMISHIGESLHHGHYVADVEINGKYFHCDDLYSDGFQEISKWRFFSRTDPYLLFLERIPDDEVKKLG